MHKGEVESDVRQATLGDGLTIRDLRLVVQGAGWLVADLVHVGPAHLFVVQQRHWQEAAGEELAPDAPRWWIAPWRTRPNPAAAIRRMADLAAAHLASLALPVGADRCHGRLLVEGVPRLPATDWMISSLAPLHHGAPEGDPLLPTRAIVEALSAPEAPESPLCCELLDADDQRQLFLLETPERGVERLQLYGIDDGAPELREQWEFLVERLATATQHGRLATMRCEWSAADGLAFAYAAWQDTLSLSDLADAIALTLPEKLEVIYQLAAVLGALHRAGIIHQRLSGIEVLMADDGPRLGGVALPLDAGFRFDAVPSLDVKALIDLLATLLGDGAALPPVHLALLEEATRGELDTFRLGELQERLAALLPPLEAPAWLPEELDGAAENALLAPGEWVGDYRIVRHLRSGGFAQVYEAVHELQDLRCALKVYDAEIADRELISELRLLQSLHHPRICRVWWCGRVPDGRACLVLEYLEGHNLGWYAWDAGRLQLAQIRQAGLDVLDALAALHAGAAGRVLFHRDVKPGNIMQVPGRGCILIDFNVAGVAGQDDGFSGTHRYSPPEVRDGTASWDASCDLFGLGVTLYELACRCFPYDSEQPTLDHPPLIPRAADHLPPLDSAWRDFLWRAVQPRATDRFTSAAEMADALRMLPVEAPREEVLL